MTFLTGTLYWDCVNEIVSGKNLSELKKQALPDTFRISFRDVLFLDLLFSVRFANQPVPKDSIITVNLLKQNVFRISRNNLKQVF